MSPVIAYLIIAGLSVALGAAILVAINYLTRWYVNRSY